MANNETTNTQCEELISKTRENSYTAKSNLGNDFFNAERCNKDINAVRADIERAMHELECVLERLDKAQACIDESLGVADAFVPIDAERGIKSDAEHYLDSARNMCLGAKCESMVAANRMFEVILRLRLAGVTPEIKD